MENKLDLKEQQGKRRLVFYMITCIVFSLFSFYFGTKYYEWKHSRRIYQQGYNQALEDMLKKMDGKPQKNGKVVG